MSWNEAQCRYMVDEYWRTGQVRCLNCEAILELRRQDNGYFFAVCPGGCGEGTLECDPTTHQAPGPMRKIAYATMMGLGLHAGHEITLPPHRRHEHGPEQEPVLATDMGATFSLRAATTNNDAPIFVQTQISQPMQAPRRAPAAAYFAPVGPPPEEKTPLSWLQ